MFNLRVVVVLGIILAILLLLLVACAIVLFSFFFLEQRNIQYIDEYCSFENLPFPKVKRNIKIVERISKVLVYFTICYYFVAAIYFLGYTIFN